MNDERKSFDLDNQKLNDDLSNWGVPLVEPSKPDCFPNDALISDEEVPPISNMPQRRAD